MFNAFIKSKKHNTVNGTSRIPKLTNLSKEEKYNFLTIKLSSKFKSITIITPIIKSFISAFKWYLSSYKPTKKIPKSGIKKDFRKKSS